jgi:hypothetical protein
MDKFYKTVVILSGTRSRCYIVPNCLRCSVLGIHNVVKGKVVSVSKYYVVKRYGGSGGIAPLILSLATRWRWVVSFIPVSFYPREKSPRYPLYWKLGGSQIRSGHSGGEEKKSHRSPCRELNPGSTARSLVSVMAELPRLLHSVEKLLNVYKEVPHFLTI